MKKTTEEKQLDFSCPVSREEVEENYELGQKAVIFVLMELAKKDSPVMLACDG